MQKISLKEYSERSGQAKAAESLGVRQSAISKAVRLGRNIIVFIQDDGVVKAEEIKPFPSQKSNV